MTGNWKGFATLMLILLLVALGPITATRANADTTFELSGRVIDQANGPFVGAIVALIDPSDTSTVASILAELNRSIRFHYKSVIDLDIVWIEGYGTK